MSEPLPIPVSTNIEFPLLTNTYVGLPTPDLIMSEFITSMIIDEQGNVTACNGVEYLKYRPPSIGEMLTSFTSDFTVIKDEFSFNSNSLETLSFPKLKISKWSITFDIPSLKTFNVPEWTIVQDSALSLIFNTIETLLFPKLKYILGGNIYISAPLLKTLEFNSLELVTSNIYIDTQELSVFIFANIKRIDNNVTILGRLPQSNVDEILRIMSSLDGTNGTTLYENHIISLLGNNSPPSATGLTYKGILEGRNCTVNVNV